MPLADKALWLQNMLYLLQQQYPADLMPLLAEYSQGALQEAMDAFPTKPSVISSNLTLFATAVEVPRTPMSPFFSMLRVKVLMIS